ncbi:hypothetical protein [Dyella sp.]|uniref:hypothetical protein n=1 Tax=Dyella sp. TaxID=1869338 RepID=UPI002ED61D64
MKRISQVALALACVLGISATAHAENYYVCKYRVLSGPRTGESRGIEYLENNKDDAHIKFEAFLRDIFGENRPPLEVKCEESPF